MTKLRAPYGNQYAPRLPECSFRLLVVCMITVSLMSACTTGEKNGASDVVHTRFELTELFRLGDELAGDTVLFGGIGELVSVDGSGRMFIGERQSPQIYVFTSEGDLIKTIGRQGSAPGEFQILESIYTDFADTLYAFDSRLERISVFEPEELKLAYNFAVSEDSLGLPYWLVGVLDTGFLVTYSWPVSPGEVLTDRRLYIMRVDWDGEVIHPPIHYLPAAEWIVSQAGEEPFAIGMPFGREPVLRMDLAGRMYAGWTESININVISPSGVLTDTITYPLTPIPLLRQEVEYYVKDNSDWYKKAVLSADLPANKPAIETFVVDDMERVWAKTTSPSVTDSTSQWLILGKENQLYGQITLPSDTDLITIRKGRAYAVDHSTGTILIVYQVREDGP